jgi:hypothetical protein
MDRLSQIIKKVIKEATSQKGAVSGQYVTPVQPGFRPFDEDSLAPFNIPVSKYDNPLVQYDSLDHKMDLRKDQIAKLEKEANKVTNFMKKHPDLTSGDDDGGVINRYMYDHKIPKGDSPMKPYTQKVPFNEWVELTHENVLNEVSTTITAGPYNAPVEIGSYEWKDSELGPFTEKVKNEFNEKSLKNTLKKNIKRVVSVWEKDKKGSYRKDINYPDTINEDLAVWFGKKKKPKGSSQPKGPWVNICRKVDGKHPPCGRHDTSKGSYPKCRASGVAGKMSDSQKRAACAQKRAAERKDPQSGKGQKPVMTSYKPRKK